LGVNVPVLSAIPPASRPPSSSAFRTPVQSKDTPRNNYHRAPPGLTWCSHCNVGLRSPPPALSSRPRNGTRPASGALRFFLASRRNLDVIPGEITVNKAGWSASLPRGVCAPRALIVVSVRPVLRQDAMPFPIFFLGFPEPGWRESYPAFDENLSSAAGGLGAQADAVTERGFGGSFSERTSWWRLKTTPVV